MSHRNLINFILFVSFLISLITVSPVFATSQTQEMLKNKQFQFIKNQGQRNANVAYYARTLGGVVFVTQKGELVYSLPKKLTSGNVSWAFKETFITKRALKPTQQGKAPFVNELSLGQVAAGIKIRLESKGDNVEKLFYLSPGADVSTIKAKFDGVEGSFIDDAGQLVLKTGLGPVLFTKPVAFQTIDNKKQPVKVAYTLSNNQYGFSLGEYDHSLELVIDPLLASTFVGGENTTGVVAYDYDFVASVETVGDYVYIGGSTQSPNFPTAMGYDSIYNTTIEGYLLRFTKDLSTLVNGTFIGNAVYGFTIDSDGTVIAVGQTSAGFPKTSGAYSYPVTYDQAGGYMARFSADLTELLAAGVIVKATSVSKVSVGNGGIYFGGTTNNPNLLVTPGAIGQNCNCDPSGSYGLRPNVGFMGRMSADLSSLEVLSYLSSSPSKILTAPDSSVYISNGRMRQYDADITTLIAEGSGASDFVFGDNEIVAVGGISNTSLPVSANAYDSTCGTDGDCNNSGTEYYIPSPDGFVAKYSMDLQNTLAATYLGGSGNDRVRVVAVNDTGDIIFSGVTYSSDFPTTANAFDRKYNAKADVFVGRFSADLSTLEYSSYIGGTHDDNVNGLTLDDTGAVYIAGETAWYDDFPTTAGAFDTTFNGGANDGYIAKFDTGTGTTNPPPNPDPNPADNIAPVADAGNDGTYSSRTSVILNGSNSSDIDGDIVSYQWQQISGKGVSLKNANSVSANFTAPSVRKGRTKTLEFELTVTDDKGATSNDRVVVTVKG